MGGKGKIINITSVYQLLQRAGAAGYDVSKGGLRNLTRTLTLELAPDKINVNNITPGIVLTPFNQAAIDDPLEAGGRTVGDRQAGRLLGIRKCRLM